MAGNAKPSLPKLKTTVASRVTSVYHGGHSQMVLGGAAGAEGEGGHDEGTWIFSYADMITILMMFFILLLSISSLDANKFEQLKNAMSMEDSKEQKTSGTGNAGVNASAGSSGTQPKGKESGALARHFAEPGIGNVPYSLLAHKVAQVSAADNNTQILAAVTTLMEAIDLKELNKSVEQQAKFEKMREQISQIKSVAQHAAKLNQSEQQTIRIIFNVDSLGNYSTQGNSGYVLTDAGRTMLIELAQSIRAFDSLSNVNIAAYLARSSNENELAATERASRVAAAVFALLAEQGIPSTQLSLAGYGYLKPKLSEVDAYGNPVQAARKTNERLEIVISRQKESSL